MPNRPLPEFIKILVIRRDNIGDLLCTTPLLSALRRRYPAAHIAILANNYNAPVLDRNPDIDMVYAYTKAKHADSPRWISLWREWRLYRALRRERFDLVIHANPVPHPRTARLVRYLNIPYQIGVDDGTRSYNLALMPEAIPPAHHVRQVYALLAPLGIKGEPGSLTLIPPAPAHRRAPDHAAPIVGIHLSTRKPCNRWPLDYYRRLIEELLGLGLEVALFWSPGSQRNRHHPGDDEMAQTLIGSFHRRIHAEPTTTLPSLIEGIAGVNLMICPDGGALHIAAALKIPTVALYGCTDSATWAPWGVDHETLRGGGAAQEITVTDVAVALQKLVHRQARWQIGSRS